MLQLIAQTIIPAPRIAYCDPALKHSRDLEMPDFAASTTYAPLKGTASLWPFPVVQLIKI